MATALQTPPTAQATPAAVGRPRRAAQYLARGALLALAVLLLGITAQVVLVSPLQQRAAQRAGFDSLRASLAEGTAPVAQTDTSGHLLAPGTPLLLLDIPELKLHQVVFEGTDSSVLSKGPGHRRDTVLPGQAGTSVIMGRAAAYGGPFGHLSQLRPGDRFTATTGQGTFTFEVLDLRWAGDRSPAAPAAGTGRLVLVTGTGYQYLPEGVLRVDADLVGKAADTPAAAVAADSVPASEQPMGTDDADLWVMVLWLQALALVSVLAVWAWNRWGRHQTWIVFAPLTAVVGLQVADQVTRLLPNLL